MVNKFIRTIVLSSAVLGLCSSGIANAGFFDGMADTSSSMFSGMTDRRYGPQDEAFEILASKTVEGLSGQTVQEKRAVVLEVCEQITHDAASQRRISPVVTMLSELEGVEYETDLKFPYLDMDMNGAKEEASCNAELWHKINDVILYSSGESRYAAGMPWPIAVYTEGDSIKVGMRLPETTIRVFLNDSPMKSFYETLGSRIRTDLERFLARSSALEDFNHEIIPIAKSSITEEKVDMLEGMIGELNTDSVAPMVTIPISAVPAALIPGGSGALEAVVGALEVAVNTPRIGDLNQDGTVDAADKAVLPGMFQMVMTGAMSMEEMGAVMATAPYVWNMGGTFQQWKSIKLVQPESQPGLYVLSVCQPFYAATAIQASKAAFHQTIMPCRLLIWEEDGNINIAITNPEVFFAAFWMDAQIDPASAMGGLFQIFPTFVLNEMIAMVNGALGEQLGLQDRMALH